MVKIKQKKQLNLPQLIEWAWENEIKNECFRRLNRGPFEYVWVNEDSNIEFDDYMLFRKNDIFEIEIEEEIMEDTRLDELVVRYRNDDIYIFPQERINDFKNDSSIVAFYIPNDDLTLTLIWAREKGLVK